MARYQGRASHFTRKVGNRERGYVVKGNAFRAFDTRKFIHVDAKRGDGDGAVGDGVTDFFTRG